MLCARLFLKYFLIFFFTAFLYFFLPTLSPVEAQYHRYFTGHVEDQAFNKYNLYAHTCSPTYNGVSTTYGPDIVSWIWNPCSVGGPTFTGDFIDSGPSTNTETITFSLPIRFSCSTTAWTIYQSGTSNVLNSGTGCNVVLQKPPGNYGSYIVVRMGPAPTPTPTPVVCTPPPQPTGLVSTCQAANQIRLSWNNDGWGHYLRIDGPNDNYNWNSGVCPAATSGPWDHCVTLPPGTNSYTFDASPNVNYNWWMHSYNVCNQPSLPGTVGTARTCTINCGNITGPSTLYVGTGANYTIDYFSSATPANGEFVLVQGGTNTLISNSNIPANFNSTISTGFVPQVANIGVANLCCGIINGPYAQCTNPAYFPTVPPTRYNCTLPNSCRVVNIVAPNEWYKLANASFHKKGLFNFTLPNTIETFDDSDDTTDAYPIIGNAGVVTTDAASITVASPYGTASEDAWQRTQVTDRDNYLGNLNNFIEYARDRKQIVTITNVNQMQSNRINLIVGNTLIGPFNQYNDNVTNAVLIVQGDLNITPETIGFQTLNPFYNPVAFMATGNINIHSEYRELNGIFIANSFDFASNFVAPNKSPMELKIKGNIISRLELNENSIKRKRTNPFQPSMFVVFDPWMYYELLPHLSTITQEGRQVE